ncbi:MAG: hypothetical protein IPJ65_28000 [Archangiaceae bacterium]|nr:hypothetical protein [Archangiaceae bacterium]
MARPLRPLPLLLLAFSCSPLPVDPGNPGGGAASAGGSASAGGGNALAGGAGGASGGTAGGTATAGGGASTAGGSGGGGASASAWQWQAVAGSQCGSGSTAGFAVNPGTSTDLFLFLQGGGACWNQGTCRPSLLRFGPICYYGANVCLYDGAGGTQPTASHVAERDPFPTDGGGALPGELAQMNAVKALDRAAPDNPFRAATFVYVPYCTGDLHSGNAQRSYAYQDVAFGPTGTFTMHFAGAANMDLYLARLKARYPNVTRIWLTGLSAGAFGATFNFDRVARAFPGAEVHLLADSGPFIDFPRYPAWRDEWSMQFPTGCTTCSDGGFPAVVEHLSTAYPNRRVALLSNDQDAVIRYFMFGGDGPDQALNPPLGGFTTGLAALESRYDAHPNARYFVVPGAGHVLWGEYGTRQADGGYTAPRQSRDGGTDLKRFIDGWATGSADFSSTR